ncbi:peroxide stress protein YaaA [Pseudaestuariivita rosea]|uniref:peroxide stress protein YaaA n=1 Tax=Pseudaestuariivita rosea TaxID=2763263 RepID=UPI001ABA7762|nr:peroxide stress protein YaaA [Pseudaestuariivita rosea]
MLVVVSPAKKLDMSPAEGLQPTQPQFQDQANVLAKVARGLSVGDLQKLMGISENLARLNADRFADFTPASTVENAKPAVLAFAGDTYVGLDAGTMDDQDLVWAQGHLRILSGLYGILRPLDLMQPYRLEMGSRLKTERGASLYDFWGGQIAQALNEQAAQVGTGILINCASQEYFGVVDLGVLKPRVVTPVFMENKSGQPKIVSFYAKKARGAMARFVIDNRLTDVEAVKEFDTGGYKFHPELSEGDKWVFTRQYPQ